MPTVNTRFVVGCIVLVGIVGLMLWSYQHSSQYQDDDPSYNSAYWEEQVHLRGGVRAYETFIQKNADAPLERQHFAAHVMGKALFSELGIEGLVICDMSFGFGCYHGFFAGALAEGGEARIKELDQVCVGAFGPLGTGCLHGIGHGILEYVGYERITDALTLCGKTTQVVPLLGCTSGVFMDYLSPLAGEGATLIPSARNVDPMNPYDPCPQVSEEFKGSCYFEFGNWLRETGGDFKTLCAGLSGFDRMHCFLGAGSAHALSSNDVDAVRAECMSLQEEDELSCRAGVAWGFFSGGHTEADVLYACAYTDANRRHQCEDLSDLTHGFDSNFPKTAP